MRFKLISKRTFSVSQFCFMETYKIKFKQPIEPEIKADGRTIIYKFKPSFEYGSPHCLGSLIEYYLSEIFEIPNDEFSDMLKDFSVMVGIPRIIYYDEFIEGLGSINHFRISNQENMLMEYYG